MATKAALFQALFQKKQIQFSLQDTRLFEVQDKYFESPKLFFTFRKLLFIFFHEKICECLINFQEGLANASKAPIIGLQMLRKPLFTTHKTRLTLLMPVENFCLRKRLRTKNEAFKKRTVYAKLLFLLKICIMQPHSHLKCNTFTLY